MSPVSTPVLIINAFDTKIKYWFILFYFILFCVILLFCFACFALLWFILFLILYFTLIFPELSTEFPDTVLFLFFSFDCRLHRELYLLILHDGRSTVDSIPDTSNNDFHQPKNVQRSTTKLRTVFSPVMTGIFGITSGGGPNISVGIFRPRFAVPLLTNRFFALVRKFGKII